MSTSESTAWHVSSAKGSAAWHRRFLAPMIVVLLLTGVVPVVFTGYLSVSESKSGAILDRDLVGLGAYERLLADSQFWNALSVQVMFVVGAVVIEMVLGMLIALAMNRDTRFMRATRTLLLAPAVLPPIVVALLFSYLLQSRVGAISYYLDLVGLPSDFLDHGHTALALLVAVDAWQFTPFVAILLLAGLQGIPTECLEAAVVDGAGYVQRVMRIVLPLLAPILVTVSLLRLIDAIQVFPTIYVLTGGGPGTSTNALNFWGFTVFFQYQDATYGSAAIVVLTAGTLAVALVLAGAMRHQWRATDRS